MSNSTIASKVQNQLRNNFFDSLSDYMDHHYSEAWGKLEEGKVKSVKVLVGDLLQIIRLHPRFTQNVFYDDDEDIIKVRKLFNLDNHGVYPIQAGGWSDESTVMLRSFLQSCGLSISRQDMVDAVNTVTKTWQRSRSFPEKLKKVISRGSYNPKIYGLIMHDWLHAMPSTDGTDWPVYWLKSLLYTIYVQQKYDVVHNGIDNFNRIPNRYTIFGSQGIGKSMLFKLVSLDDSLDFDGSFKNDDTWRRLTSHTLINMDDKAFRGSRSDNDELKSAISQSYATFRLPYAKAPVTKIFRGVFVGSSNRQNVYRDTTGWRREFPLDVGYDQKTGQMLSKPESERIGQLWFKEKLNKMHTPQIQADLWKTFIVDFQKAEQEGKEIQPILSPDDPLYKYRATLYQDHMIISDAQNALEILLRSRHLPENFFSTAALTKNQKIAALAQEDYRGVDPKGLMNKIPTDGVAYLGLDHFKKINGTILTSAVRTMAESRVTVDLVDSLMSDYGFKGKRSAHGRFYEKK